jgi:hypothetical protein
MYLPVSLSLCSCDGSLISRWTKLLKLFGFFKLFPLCFLVKKKRKIHSFPLSRKKMLSITSTVTRTRHVKSEDKKFVFHWSHKAFSQSSSLWLLWSRRWLLGFNFFSMISLRDFRFWRLCVNFMHTKIESNHVAVSFITRSNRCFLLININILGS